MWTRITRLILQNRLINLIVIGLLTVFMGYQATRLEMSYELAKALPETDSTMIVYNNFLNEYGQDGSMIFVAVKDDSFFSLDHFNEWCSLCDTVEATEGVNNVLSVPNLFDVNIDLQNSTNKDDWRFRMNKLVEQNPQSQAELDSIEELVRSLEFYEGMLFNSGENVWIMLITLDNEYINAREREVISFRIRDLVESYSEKYGVEIHISGMPYIRTQIAHTVKFELVLFTFIALVMAMIILLLFFKSFRTVIPIMTIVVVAVIFLMGIVAMFGFKITIFMSVLPPILIIIGVENSIFLLNKYYQEYQKTHRQAKALSSVIRRIGSANLITNATTAAGFASFIITKNKMLVEFGIVASISIFVAYILSLFLIPIFFSYMRVPDEKDFARSDNKFIRRILDVVVNVAFEHRIAVYIVLAVLVTVGGIGVSRLRTMGRMVDDISKKDPIYQDLLFFEKNLKGIVPLEISIQTKADKTGKVSNTRRAATIAKIEQLQDTLALYPELSKPLSVAEAVKFANSHVVNVPSGFDASDIGVYAIPSVMTMKKLMDGVAQGGKADSLEIPNIIRSFIGGEKMTDTRVSVRMLNLTTPEVDALQQSLGPKVQSIFPAKNYDVKLTGSCIVNNEGTKYLTTNLLYSLILAFVIIALLMALTFTSFKMVVISMIPNFIPQLLTAGMMGFLGIPIKMSTILIFSIALGISVDNTIHFLARYRLQLRLNDWSIGRSVKGAILETGYSMVSSATVLLSGFLMFVFSSFQGTQVVGYLVPFTLLMALCSNLFILPCILLTFNKKLVTENFKNSLVEMRQSPEEKQEVEKIISDTISDNGQI